MADQKKFIAQSFADDSAPIVARVSETGESVFIEQGNDPDNVWAGDRVVFDIANAEKVIEAIRAAVAAHNAAKAAAA